MLLPSYLLVLLLALPLLIMSSPQQGRQSGSLLPGACNLLCGPGNICNLGSCIPCSAVGCGPGANCYAVNQARNVWCNCPDNTKGDPVDPGCYPVKSCNNNFQCGNNEYCDKGICAVDPCFRVKCGTNTRCEVVRGGKAECRPIPGCTANSQCGNSGICDSGRCFADPCAVVRCGTNTKCVYLGEGQAACRPVSGCITNSQCGNNGICDSGRCFADPCATVRCGTNTKCVALGERQAECRPVSGCRGDSQCRNNEICNGGRCVVNPCSTTQCGTNNECVVVRGEVQCKHVPETSVSNRDTSQGAGVSDDTQSSSQGNSSQEGLQGNIPQKDNQGNVSQDVNEDGATQGGNEGGITQGVHDVGVNPGGNQEAAAQGNNQEGTAHGNNQGSGAQEVNQSGSTMSGNQQGSMSDRPKVCKINSQCGNNERCQSRICVDPCIKLQCGQGSVCQVSQRQPQCVCPDGTEGDPRKECKAKPENPMTGANQSSTASNPGSSDIAFPGENTKPEKGTREPGCGTRPDPGECRGAFKRYYYNKDTDQCDCFLFGGCDEDRVKFSWVTLEECQRICVPGNKDQGPGCKRATLEEVQTFLEEQRKNRENN